MFPTFYSRKYSAPYKLMAEKLVCKDDEVPVINGIPRFVKSGAYASLFGDQWKKFDKTQLDSYSGTSISRKRLERCLGDLSSNMDGKSVLEAGCGAGRFTEVLLEKGSRLVSADLSAAVEVNAKNFPISDRHIVIQADINDMPFGKESFDIVICLGVIQHTPHSEIAISRLYELVKKGGSLIIDHYTYAKSKLFRFASIYRWYLKRKDAKFTISYCEKLVDRFLPWHKRFKNNKLASVLLNRVSPVISYYSAFPELSDEHQRQWAFLDTHDSLTDWYKRFKTKDEIIKTLKELGAINIWCEKGGNGVEARCQKP
jgi:SAM-dependent methyltransferase